MSIDWDDIRPVPRPQIVVGEKLETLSVEELEGRIAALQAEIVRVTAELATKRARVEAAAALFKG